MNPESTTDQALVEEEGKRQTRRRVWLLVGMMLLVVVVGAVPIFVFLGGPSSELGRRLGFDVTLGPTVAASSFVGPIEVKPSDALAEAGVTVAHVGSSSTSSSSLLGHRESRGYTVRISAAKNAIELEDLAFTLIDDQDKVIGEGPVTLPAKVDIGESADGKVQLQLPDDAGAPAKLIIRGKDEP